MAQDIVSGLFGLSPNDVAQQQWMNTNQAADKFAQMSPLQRSAQMMFKGGSGLAQAGAGMLGIQNPQIEEAKMTEAALTGLDISDPRAIAQRAQQIQDPHLKMKLMILAQQRAKEMQDSELRSAQIDQTKAHAQYYRQGGKTVQGTMSDLSRWQVRRSDVIKSAISKAQEGAYSLPPDQRQEAIENAVRQAVSVYDATNPRPDGTLPESASQPVQQTAPVQSSPSLPIQVSAFPSVSGPEQIKRDEERIAIIEAEIAAKPDDPNTPALKTELENARKRIEKLKSLSPAAKSPVAIPTKAEQEGAIAREKKAGTDLGENDVTRYATVSKAPAALEKIDALEKQIQSGNVNTGIAAEFKTVIDKIRSALGDKATKASPTEIANAMMGQEVFAAIQALGIGARGMDTPAEREYLRQVLAGTIPLEKETLLEMARMRRKALEDEVNRWNSDVDSGKVAKVFDRSYKVEIKGPAQILAPVRSAPPAGAVRRIP